MTMQRWLITGAGRGIGLELTRNLLRRGDMVIGSVRSAPAANALKSKFAGMEAARLQVLVFDVRDRNAIARAAAQVTECLDVIVNNAGILGRDPQSVLEMDFDAFLETLMVNTMGPLAVTQAFLPHLHTADRPRIVCVTSRMGSFTSYQKPDLIAYQASKAGANKVVCALAATLGQRGITVIAAHPGLVRTELAGTRATDSPNSISPAVSAMGLLTVIDGLQKSDNGLFYNYDGKEIGW